MLVFLFAVLLAVGVVEGGVRVWLNTGASDTQLRRFGTISHNERRNADPMASIFMYEPHRYIGYVPKPNYEKGQNRHNKWGYRGTDFPLKKPKGEYRIACLGGSTTYTSAVEDVSKSYPAQLEAVLKESGLPNVRVINSGASGWSSYETLVNYEFRLVETQPDLLIVYHGINDATARLVWPKAAYRADNSGWALSGATAPDTPWYERSDALRTLLISFGRIDSPMSLHLVMGRPAPTNIYWSYRNQFDRGAYPEGLFLRHPVSTVFETNPPVNFVRNIEHLVQMAKSDGADVVLVTFKIADGIDTVFNNDAFRAAVNEQNDAIKEIGQRLDVKVYDFAADFSDDPQYFSDSVHVNEPGARLKAEYIARYLTENGLADAVASTMAASPGTARSSNQ